MRLTFSVQPGAALGGTLNYLRSEHSFLYEVQSRADLVERVGAAGVTSLVVDTLQLEIGIASGEAMFVWGYFPMGPWISTKLTPPNFSAGRVVVASDKQFEEGVSVSISDIDWRTDYDSTAGWVNTRARNDSGAQFVQIADGVVLGIDGGELISIWLKPVFSA